MRRQGRTQKYIVEGLRTLFWKLPRLEKSKEWFRELSNCTVILPFLSVSPPLSLLSASSAFNLYDGGAAPNWSRWQEDRKPHSKTTSKTQDIFLAG